MGRNVHHETLSYARNLPRRESPSALARFVKRWSTTPPPGWHIFAAFAIAIVMIYASSTVLGARLFLLQGGLPCALAGLILLWPGGAAILGIDYAVRLLGCAMGRVSTWRRWRWYVTPVCLTLTILATHSNWLLRLRFQRSLPAFEKEAGILLAGPGTTPEDWEVDVWYPMTRAFGKRVDGYEVSAVAVFPEERVVYFFTGDSLWSGWGFLYNPDQRNIVWGKETLAPGWQRMIYFPPK
jgi:hypothetical protein